MDMKSFQKSCGRVLAVFTLSLCATASADETLSTNVTLTADADWRSKGTVTINPGVTVNLNGHKLTVAGLAGTNEAMDLTSPDGKASSSANTWGDIDGGPFSAIRAFNDKPERTHGRFAASKVNGQFIATVDYDFGEGNEQVVNMYKVYAEPTSGMWSRCPKSWVFYGSNDGVTWTELHSCPSETGWSTATWCRTKTFENTTAYRHYRIEFTANNGNGDALEFTQLEYFSVRPATVTSPLVDLTQPDGAFSTTNVIEGVGRVFNDKPSNVDGGRIDVNPRNLPFVIDYDFGEGNEKIVNAYKVYCHPNAGLPRRCPKTWYFYGSNDGKSWTKLDSRLSETGWSSSLECRTKTFANTTAYRHYRIEFTANNGDGDTLQITQLEYFSPATLCVDIPEGVVNDNQNVAINGAIRVVKDGAGTFVANRAEQEYLGGTHVVAGTLKCGSGALVNELGDQASAVVEKDAVFDVNGWKNIYTCDITLAGGTLTNTGYDFGAGDAQISRLTLTADSYVTAPHYLGLIAANSGVALLDLGGHTLHLSYDYMFRLTNVKAVTPGVISVVDVPDSALLSFVNGESQLQDVSLDLTGPVILYSNVKIGDLRLDANTTCNSQPSKFQVYGKLTPLIDDYCNVELQDGSTLDLSERTGALNVASQLANQRLTFAQDATVTLDFGDRRPKSGEMVLEWDEKPAGLQPSQFKIEANGRSYRVNLSDEGLYLSSGMVILVK